MKPFINIVLDHWYEQVLLYLFLGLALFGVIIGIIKIIKLLLGWFKSGGKVSSSALTIGNTLVTPAKPAPAHANCPHAGDIMSVVARTAEFVELKHRLPNIIMEKQMKYFEEKEVELQGMYLRVFIKELDNAIPDGREVVQHPEYISYSSTLLTVGRFLKDYIRVAMRQNHFVDIDGDAWVEKKNRYKTMIAEKATEMLNLYWRGSVVTRGVLYNINHDPDMVRQLNSAVDDLFEYAREEARKLDEEIGTAREEYEKFLQDKITG
jgi:hypothetical protein